MHSEFIALPTGAESALGEYRNRLLLADTPLATRQQMRETASAVATVARRANLLPEELIIGIKNSWMRHESLGASAERHRLRWVLTEMISLCIDEYYRVAPIERVDVPRAQLQRDAS